MLRFFIVSSHNEFIEIVDGVSGMVVLQTRRIISGSHHYAQRKCNELNKRFNG